MPRMVCLWTSWCVSWREAYGAYSTGGGPDLAGVMAVQYSDWAAWQRSCLATGLEEKVAPARDRLAIGFTVLS